MGNVCSPMILTGCELDIVTCAGNARDDDEAADLRRSWQQILVSASICQQAEMPNLKVLWRIAAQVRERQEVAQHRDGQQGS